MMKKLRRRAPEPITCKAEQIDPALAGLMGKVTELKAYYETEGKKWKTRIFNLQQYDCIPGLPLCVIERGIIRWKISNLEFEFKDQPLTYFALDGEKLYTMLRDAIVTQITAWYTEMPAPEKFCRHCGMEME